MFMEDLHVAGTILGSGDAVVKEIPAGLELTFCAVVGGLYTVLGAGVCVCVRMCMHLLLSSEVASTSSIH